MTYDILIETLSPNTYQATVLGWPDLRVVGESETMVVEQIKESLRKQLAQSKIVRLETKDIFHNLPTNPETKHPWMQFAGIFADDEEWDDYLKCLAEVRHELNQIEEVAE